MRVCVRARVPTSEKAYTPEQAAAVKRIRKLENYYEILDVPKDASDADIKKAYKRVRAPDEFFFYGRKGGITDGGHGTARVGYGRGRVGYGRAREG